MGRKRVIVGTTVSRVIGNDRLPNAIESGVTRALYQDGDIRDYVLEELISSIGVKAERMYSYGRDHYVHGLPSGQFTVAAENIDEVVGTVLFSIENVAVTTDYLQHGPPNNLHIGWIKLLELHGYDPATNQLAELTTIKGTPVFLHDMVVVVPEAALATIEPRSLEQWGTTAKAGYTPQRQTSSPLIRAMRAPTAVEADPVALSEFLRVEYVWETPTGVEKDSFTIPVTGYDEDSDYFHVRYRVGTVVKYWMYKDGAGTYPTLDALFDHAPLSNGSFFPFAYFRYNHTSENADKTTDAYKTTKKLVRYLGMDYDQVADAINDNPDIADVAQAMLIMAVPANTTNPLEQRYLWEFFNNLYLASSPENRHRTEDEAILAAQQNEQLGLRAPGMVIQDARFKMSLDNMGIYKRRKAGSIGPIGSFGSAFAVKDVLFEYTVEGEGGHMVHYATVPITSHYYRCQISRGFYDEIQVVEMRTLFHIFEKYSAIGDGEDNILLIPLDRAITSTFSIPDREKLYARSLHVVFNSMVIIKIKWYQTGIFQAILIIVAIAITIWSGGTAAPEMFALINAGQYAAAAYLFLVEIIKIVIVQIVFKLFVKAVGLEAAFAIAIIAAAFGVIDVINTGSLSGAPFAADLLQLSSGLTTAIGTQMKTNMQDLLNQSKEFELLKAEQIKLLDTAKELLENNNILTPFMVFGEKPDEFYNRTVHSGNIGVVGISAISSFVDHALRLPDFNESIGKGEYVEELKPVLPG